MKPREVLSYGSTSCILRANQLYQTLPDLTLTVHIEGGFVVVDGNQMGQVAHVPAQGIFELVQTAAHPDNFTWRIDFHWPNNVTRADSNKPSAFKADTKYLNMHADVLVAWCINGYILIDGVQVGAKGYIPRGATYEFKATSQGFWAQACDANSNKPLPPAEKLYVVFDSAAGEGVVFDHKPDAIFAATGRTTPGELGVNTLADAWREHTEGLTFPIYEIDKPVIEHCDLSPKGWKCTRAIGHDGPCACIEV